MPLSRDVIEHVARLAHVGLQPHEVDEFTLELAPVLDHVARLQQLDTTDVEPTAHAGSLDSVVRQDEVRPSWPIESVLTNAPRRDGDLFEVQAVFE
jgi:aspartyl-tRNA(Asn)/glutamyl-tRNA(Gln) amidotransferase subunit C